MESCTSGKSDVLEKLLNSVFPIAKKSSLHNLYFIEQMYFFGDTIRLYLYFIEQMYFFGDTIRLYFFIR